MATVRRYYSSYGVFVGPSPATGFQFQTGFNDVYTGANSGFNLIQNLQRVQSITNGLSQDYTIINQAGQLSYVSQEITTPPTVNIGVSYYVADLSNERILGFNVSGLGALGPILDQSQATKNYWVGLSADGTDMIGFTGQTQCELMSNGQLASWSTEGSVGNIPTTTIAVQALNYATYTGSFNQPLYAIDISNTGGYIPNKIFTLPVASSGIAPTAAALRPSDILVSITDAAFGLSISDLKAQSYSIGADFNIQPLNKLGSLFPYALVPTFPLPLNVSASFYFGDLITGSYRDVICSNSPKTIRIAITDPCSNTEAVAYEARGVKLTSQSFDSQDIGSIAGVVNLAWVGQVGSSSDSRVNLLMSGRNVSA